MNLLSICFCLCSKMSFSFLSFARLRSILPQGCTVFEKVLNNRLTVFLFKFGLALPIFIFTEFWACIRCSIDSIWKIISFLACIRFSIFRIHNLYHSVYIWKLLLKRWITPHQLRFHLLILGSKHYWSHRWNVLNASMHLKTFNSKQLTIDSFLLRIYCF